jgi:hypothetical protein
VSREAVLKTKYATCLVAALAAVGVSTSTHVAAATTPRQCFAYTAAGSPKFTISQAQGLQSSPCAGISWTFPWNELEPSAGVYNWSFIDNALAAAGSKPSILRVIPGITSPSWLPRADGVVMPNPKGGSAWMPIPWNADFLASWKTFITAFGARYNANTHIAMIEGGGDGPQGEAHLTGTYAQWAAVGYSEQTYVGAIATEINDFKAAFPSHKVSFAGATPPTGSPKTPNLLADFISTCQTANIVIQNNGLSGSKYGHINQSVIEFGYQTASSLGSGLGAALRLATSLGASFVEVYYVDATNPENYAAISAFQSS